MLTLPGRWVWDFWFADDGDRFHVFYLYAPTSLGEEHRRHRAARIGHSVSLDLVSWTALPDPFGVGDPDAFDGTATWTGNVVRDGDVWRMYYTGSRFLAPEPAIANIETVGEAVSRDLVTWEKLPGPIVRADPRWYETWESGTWKEEAWRDPWVFPDPAGHGWHMLVTARADSGEVDDRGVLGHAVSADLRTWSVQPPLTRPGAGFAHLEVPQVALVEGRWVVLFSCGEDTLVEAQRQAHPRAATWALTVEDPTEPFDISRAEPVLTDEFYSGRLVQRRDGTWAMLAFRTVDADGVFLGGISDPMPARIGVGGKLVVGSAGG